MYKQKHESIVEADAPCLPLPWLAREYATPLHSRCGRQKCAFPMLSGTTHFHSTFPRGEKNHMPPLHELRSWNLNPL